MTWFISLSSFPSFSRCTHYSGPAPALPLHDAIVQQSSSSGTGSKQSVPAPHISVSSETSCAPVCQGQQPTLALQSHSLTVQKSCVFCILVMLSNFCSFISLAATSKKYIKWCMRKAVTRQSRYISHIFFSEIYLQ